MNISRSDAIPIGGQVIGGKESSFFPPVAHSCQSRVPRFLWQRYIPRGYVAGRCLPTGSGAADASQEALGPVMAPERLQAERGLPMPPKQLSSLSVPSERLQGTLMHLKRLQGQRWLRAEGCRCLLNSSVARWFLLKGFTDRRCIP